MSLYCAIKYIIFPLGKLEDIQSIIEAPEIQMLARCPSSNEQLFYSDSRLEELITLSVPINLNEDIKLNDIIRIFKGLIFDF